MKRRYSDYQTGTFAKALHHKEYVLVGNIAIDGRWIKLKKPLFDYIMYMINNSNEEIDDDIMKIIFSLEEIKYIKDKNSGPHLINNVFDKITIELTTMCNLECKHCSGNFGKIDDINEMSFDTFKDIVMLAEEKKVKKIILTGGEIFCRNDIYKLLNFCRNNFSGVVGVMTNGTLISKEDISKLVEYIDYINISMDGHDEKSMSKIRGIGVFEKVDKLIKQLNETKVGITVSCVSINNSVNVAEFINYANKHNVRPSVRQLNYKGGARENYSFDLEEQSNIAHIDTKSLSFKSVCNQLYNSIFISSYSTVHKCAALNDARYSVGHYKDLFNKSEIPVFTDPIVDLVEGCKDCNIRYFCCSSCESVNNEIYTDSNLLKIRCRTRGDVIRSVIGR